MSRAQNDFVQDYAAKRAAQMERAKALREQRKAEAPANQTPPLGAGHYSNQRPNSLNPPEEYGSGSYDMPGAINSPTYSQPQQQHQRQQHQYQREQEYPPPLNQTRTPSHTQANKTGSAGSLPAMATTNRGQDPVEVSESDFQRAVAMGIISADQARQLWSTISSGNPAPPPMPMSYQPQPKSYATLDSGHGDNGGYQPSRFNPQEQQYDDDERYEQPVRKPASKAAKNAKPEWNTDAPEYHDPPEPEPEVVPRRQTKAAQAKTKPVQAKEWNSEFTDENAMYNNPAPVVEKKRTTRQPTNQQRAPAEETKPIAPLSLQPQSGGGSRQSGQAQRAGERPSQAQRAGAPKQAPPSPAQLAPLGQDAEIAEMERQRLEAAARFEAELAGAEKSEPMASCQICDRTFRRSIITKHEAACAKANKKRKEFNMANQRADGVEGLQEAQRDAKREAKFAPKQAPKAGAGAKMPKWKIQSQQLQAAMNAMRPSEGGGGGAPAPMPEAIDDRVPCPHCGRKFNHDVADRHIPKCKTTQAKPNMLLRKR